MIKQEYYKTRKDGVTLYRTYSDQGLKIKKTETNKIYTAAIDVYPSRFTYTEVTEEEYQEYLEKQRNNLRQ